MNTNTGRFPEPGIRASHGGETPGSHGGETPGHRSQLTHDDQDEYEEGSEQDRVEDLVKGIYTHMYHVCILIMKTLSQANKIA